MSQGPRVLAISTTTHDPALSTSIAMQSHALRRLLDFLPGAEIRTINANDLHIVKNLSCYANGKRDCANPDSGPYRCWAHYESVKNPKKYGGVDQMPVIYDALNWAQVVIWSTSTRWGSHSALMQTVIERMDTLENRAVSWGERNPLAGKRCGVIAGGLHWKTPQVADHLQEVFAWLGFDVPEAAKLVWQRTNDPFFEHPDPDKPYVERWMQTQRGDEALTGFIRALLRA
jgi:multimeric flavodoxin WrbA